jgi:threonine/homoserine/homoserine lactone efflux protein
VVLIVVPGPDMMFIVATAVRGGSLAGLSAAAGTAVGLMVHTAAAVLGLSAVITALPVLFPVLRWAGVCYLLLLAARAFRRGPLAGAGERAAAGAAPSRLQAFRRAVVVDVLNPKSSLFFVAFLPQFVVPGRGHLDEQFLLLGATFVAIDLVVDGLVGVASGRFAERLRHSRRLTRGLDIASGTILVALAAWLAGSAS